VLWEQIEEAENLVNSGGGIVSLSKCGHGNLQLVQPHQLRAYEGDKLLPTCSHRMPTVSIIHPSQRADNRMAAPAMDVVVTSLHPPSTLNPRSHFGSSSSFIVGC
jgi:hypothetical protein